MQTLKALTALYKAGMRLIFGYEFMCWHQNADGTRNVFHCTTLQDAMEWASCALNCSSVKIIDRNGYLLCQRFPIA